MAGSPKSSSRLVLNGRQLHGFFVHLTDAGLQYAQSKGAL